MLVFFFFQAEDGIRVGRVTGVQTCALPICRPELGQGVEPRLGGPPVVPVGPVPTQLLDVAQRDALRPVVYRFSLGPSRASQAVAEVVEVGRASCRERV